MAEIHGADLVTGLFGYWPSFHDAEVVRMSLERTPHYEAGPYLLLDVHAFEITSEVDAHGRYVLRHHVLVSLRCDGVQDLELNGFNNQNAVDEIAFNEVGPATLPEPVYPALSQPAHEVVIDGVHGVSAVFRCREVTVTAVRPWNAETGAPAA